MPMSGLVMRSSDGKAVSYMGTAYQNPAEGKRKLCIRTGTAQNDVVRYGFTSDRSASQYCGMRMCIDGNTAYIGRSITQSRSSSYSTQTTQQATRSSAYVSSSTLVTQSKTSKSTFTTSLVSTVTGSVPLTYTSSFTYYTYNTIRATSYATYTSGYSTYSGTQHRTVTASRQLSTASKSSLSTKTATRSSNYASTITGSATRSSGYRTHNFNM